MGGFPEVSAPARATNIIQVTGGSGEEHDVFHDCRRLAEGAAQSAAAAAVVAGLNNAAITQSPHFAVHSGVVGWGRGIVAFPNESGNGKTTLTAALIRQGLVFFSDEALVFTETGTVLPYPKPFAFSPWSAKIFGLDAAESELLVTAEELGGAVGEEGRLTDLVLSEYGHEDMNLESLPKSQAVAALIRYSFNHYQDPERAFRIATDVAREIRVWRLGYHDPMAAASLLAQSLS